jgi:hypothetical protein
VRAEGAEGTDRGPGTELPSELLFALAAHHHRGRLWWSSGELELGLAAATLIELGWAGQLRFGPGSAVSLAPGAVRGAGPVQDHVLARLARRPRERPATSWLVACGHGLVGLAAGSGPRTPAVGPTVLGEQTGRPAVAAALLGAELGLCERSPGHVALADELTLRMAAALSGALLGARAALALPC